MTKKTTDAILSGVIPGFLRSIVELVYPPTEFTSPPRGPLDLSGEFVRPGPCRIELNRPPFCLKCSRFLGPRPRHPLCLTCRRHPPEFDFAWSACLYRHGLPGLLHAYKYRQKTFYRHFFSRLMLDFAGFYSLDIRRFDLILPVPLHSARFRERGYNQSELLAAPVACRYGIPCRPRLLIRSRSTPSQTGLTGKERWTNLRSAFKIHPHADIINKNILIIDDLITTGATASQAAATLKDAGAATVGVFTLAATP